MNTNASTYPPNEDDRIARRAIELFAAWEQDPQKLAEAAEQVLGFTSYADHLARDVAGAMLGHPDDQTARDVRFMEDLRGRVIEVLREEAREQAEEEFREPTGPDYDYYETRAA